MNEIIIVITPIILGLKRKNELLSFNYRTKTSHEKFRFFKSSHSHSEAFDKDF